MEAVAAAMRSSCQMLRNYRYYYSKSVAAAVVVGKAVLHHLDLLLLGKQKKFPHFSEIDGCKK